jgi:nucleotide-binding universal stress UspA family protein
MKTYLVALDSSIRAPQVLDQACAMAQGTGAKLVLFRAVGLPSDLPVEAYAMSPDGVVSVLQQRATTELADLSKRIPAGIPFEVRQDIGSAWQSICETARQVGASLIVIGSHGYSGLDRLLGTTASRVVNHADRSVMVVRPVPGDPG